MAKKQQLRALQEKNIGALGLKIPKVISDQIKISDSQKVVNGKKLAGPTAWRTQDLHLVVSNSEHRPIEDSFSPLISKVTSHWRWWGETYGYFNRKVDAVAFKQELDTAISLKLIVPSSAIWQQIGLKQDKSNDWYIDPETSEAKQLEGAHQRPDGLHDQSALTKQFAEVTPNSRLALFHISTDIPDQLTDKSSKTQVLLHLAKLVTIAGDISIHMARFQNEAAAVQSSGLRPLILDIHSHSTDLDVNTIRAGAYLTSAELAHLHQTSTSSPQDFDISAEFASFRSELTRQEKYLAEYGQGLISESGVRNYILVGKQLTSDPLNQAWDPEVPQQQEVIEEIPEVKAIELVQPEQPEKPEPIIDPTPVVEIDPVQATVIKDIEPEIEQDIDLESEVESISRSATNVPPTEPISPEPEVPPHTATPAEVVSLMETEPQQGLPTDEFHSLTHLFTIDGIKCSVTLATQQQQPVWIRVGAYKCDPTVSVLLETTSHLLSRLAQSGLTAEEIGEELSGIAFSPMTETHRSILDYVGKWVAVKAKQLAS